MNYYLHCTLYAATGQSRFEPNGATRARPLWQRREMTIQVVRNWHMQDGTKTWHIDPGSPCENGCFGASRHRATAQALMTPFDRVHRLPQTAGVADVSALGCSTLMRMRERSDLPAEQTMLPGQIKLQRHNCRGLKKNAAEQKV